MFCSESNQHSKSNSWLNHTKNSTNTLQTASNNRLGNFWSGYAKLCERQNKTIEPRNLQVNEVWRVSSGVQACSFSSPVRQTCRYRCVTQRKPKPKPRRFPRWRAGVCSASADWNVFYCSRQQHGSHSRCVTRVRLFVEQTVTTPCSRKCSV